MQMSSFTQCNDEVQQLILVSLFFKTVSLTFFSWWSYSESCFKEPHLGYTHCKVQLKSPWLALSSSLRTTSLLARSSSGQWNEVGLHLPGHLAPSGLFSRSSFEDIHMLRHSSSPLSFEPWWKRQGITQHDLKYPAPLAPFQRHISPYTLGWNSGFYACKQRWLLNKVASGVIKQSIIFLALTSQCISMISCIYSCYWKCSMWMSKSPSGSVRNIVKAKHC